ncbi:head-tail joining protein [Roseococcus microcysteis]|uniref:head-tail joining protein n=1 Tax=Roseococcus microcysteis TaxID=2771361 RepID=UPI00168AD57E|nr:hypothetical protein [Roseococcus microcysteis]
MNAFAAAAAVLCANPDLGDDAEYYVAPWNVRHQVRVILSRPDVAAVGFQLSSTVGSYTISLPVAALPEAPVEGGRFDVAGEIYEVRQAQRDETRTMWVVECSLC